MATGMETWPAVKLPGVRITITNYKTFQRVWCIHQPVQKLVFRLKGPPISSHNPLDGLRGQPCELVRNWTSPETMKRKKTTPKVVNLPGHSIMSHLLGQADHSLGQRWKKEGWRSRQLLIFEIQKRWVPKQRAAVQQKRHSTRWEAKNGRLLHFT